MSSIAVTHPDYAAHYEMLRTFTPGAEVVIVLEAGWAMSFELVDAMTRKRVEADVDVYRVAGAMYSSIDPSRIWPKLILHSSDGRFDLMHVNDDIETMWLDVEDYDPFFMFMPPTSSSRSIVVDLWPTQPLRLWCVDGNGSAIRGCYGSGASTYRWPVLDQSQTKEFELMGGQEAGLLAVSSSDVPYEGQATIVVQAPGYRPEQLAVSKWECQAGAERRVVMHRSEE